MSKFNFKDIVSSIHESYGKDEKRKKQFGLASDLKQISGDPSDYVVLPDWFKKHFGILGIPFGKFVQISGKPDAGKTSLSLLSMKCAIEQGYGVIYVETEGKTGPEDFRSAGIDPDSVFLINSAITEEIFEAVNVTLDTFFDKYPTEKILLVFDSYGNTTSLRDRDLKQTEKAAKVGGAAQSNRLGLGAIQVRQKVNEIAVLVVNYSYANIGSVGETNAGGRGLEFLSSLIIQASRKAWYEKTVQGIKVRAGADVVWKVTKNHFAKSLVDDNGNQLLLPKEAVLRITAEGFKPLT